MNKFNRKIGNVIKRKRLKCHLKQNELGEKIGVTKSTISRYESGNIDIPASKLYEISDICNFPMRDYSADTDSEEVISLVLGFRTKEERDRQKQTKLLNKVIEYYMQKEHRKELEGICAAYDYSVSCPGTDVTMIVESYISQMNNTVLQSRLLAYYKAFLKAGHEKRTNHS